MATLTLRREDGRIVCERVVVADRAHRRMRGLLGRKYLRQGEGMVLRPGWSIHTAFMRFPIDAVFLDAKVEEELLELDEESARELLESIGQPEPGLYSLARAGFHTLGLQTYLTAGPKESRAWTIPQGATAPQAAGVIHTDFERGFIKAETVAYDDLVACGSTAAARDKGLYRMEGKEYVVQDGDVMLFKFNV